MASTSKRPASVNQISSPSPPKRRRSYSPDSKPLNIYLVDAKLDAEAIEEIQRLVDQFPERQLRLCLSAKEADIVVTNIHMKQRLQRHLDWDTAKQRAIVTPQWLRDSVKSKQILPCGNYAALSELHDETVRNCPDDCPQNSESSDRDSVHEPPKKKKASNINYSHYYACMRHSPLVCPNQKLVKKLAVLRSHRELEDKEMQALSYERAISVLKAFPHDIAPDNMHEVSKLPHIGAKIYSKIQEFIQHGDISECKSILNDTRYQSLDLFTTIYGIGPSTARKLYSAGLRTVKDLEKHYGVTPDHAHADSLDPQRLFASAKTTLPELSIKVALALREELSMQIPRGEVEAIHNVVMKELRQIRSGCMSTITGGYRRGKIESNDIDIVISHKDLKSGGSEVKGLCTELVKHLVNKGLITHVTHLSSFREHNALRTSHWDSLEKALTVFKLPDQGDGSKSEDQDLTQKHVHRRLDLIFAGPKVYWTAVVGWTGSKMFERDLRFWAKQEKGMKFDSSGISRRHDSKLYFPTSEKEVFELLDLEYIDPTLRNADL